MTRSETLANLSPLPTQEPPRGLESFAADSLRPFRCLLPPRSSSSAAIPAIARWNSRPVLPASQRPHDVHTAAPNCIDWRVPNEPKRNKGGRPRRDIDTAGLVKLRAEGMSWPALARRLKCGQGTVRGYQQAASMPCQNPKAGVLQPEVNELNTGTGL